MKRMIHCLKCHKVFDQRYANPISEDRIVFLVCPHCQRSELELVPHAVINAIAKKFDDQSYTDTILDQLRYDSLNGCYAFDFAGMYHGVETDGYIHT